MGRVEAAPAAQADLTPSTGSPPSPGAEALHSFWEQKFEWAEATAILARYTLPAGLTNGHRRCIASHWIWR